MCSIHLFTLNPFTVTAYLLNLSLSSFAGTFTGLCIGDLVQMTLVMESVGIRIFYCHFKLVVIWYIVNN